MGKINVGCTLFVIVPNYYIALNKTRQLLVLQDILELLKTL